MHSLHPMHGKKRGKENGKKLTTVIIFLPKSITTPNHRLLGHSVNCEFICEIVANMSTSTAVFENLYSPWICSKLLLATQKIRYDTDKN